MPSNMTDEDPILVVRFQELEVNPATIVGRTPTNFQVLLHYIFRTREGNRSF